jgi:cellulose synthase/poly-beta-1,6-N-acetylglucosamine synthase-like glycosyltransferase
VEQSVTWNYPVFASEDLIFGQVAASKGLLWGFFYDYMYINSPWSFRDFFKQRRRWMWGNIHAVLHVLPMKARALVVGQYLTGFFSFCIATVGAPLDLMGLLDIPAGLRIPIFVTLFLWLGTFAFSGWINSRGSMKHALIAALLAWVTSAVQVGVLLLAIAVGSPRRFEVIRKTRESSPRSVVRGQQGFP